MTTVVVKRLTRTEDPNTIVTYMTLLATPLALLIAVPGWVWPDAATWFWLVALGLLTGRGGLLMLTEAGLRNSLPTWPSKEAA